MSLPEIKLTPKQEAFCHSYLETGNASEGYRSAYSTSNMKPETINRRAKDLLDHSKIQARMAQLQDELKEVSDISKERILYEIKSILDSSIADYLTFDGYKVIFKPFDQLTKRQLRAIEGIKQKKDGEIELKLHGKAWTTDRACKMLGYEAPKKLDHTSKGDKINTGKVIVLPPNGRESAATD